MLKGITFILSTLIVFLACEQGVVSLTALSEASTSLSPQKVPETKDASDLSASLGRETHTSSGQRVLLWSTCGSRV